MKVYLSNIDARGDWSGSEVFMTRAGAVNSIIFRCRQAGLDFAESDCSVSSEDEARAALTRGDTVRFEGSRTYFSVEERDLLGAPSETGEPELTDIEPLVAVSTVHVTPGALEWMSAGGEGAVFHQNDYGGLLYVPGQEWGEPSAAVAGVPAEVRAVAAWAAERGIVWVKFDGDGTKHPALETFIH